jgi:hypothetical protein
MAVATGVDVDWFSSIPASPSLPVHVFISSLGSLLTSSSHKWWKGVGPLAQSSSLLFSVWADCGFHSTIPLLIVPWPGCPVCQLIPYDKVGWSTLFLFLSIPCLPFYDYPCIVFHLCILDLQRIPTFACASCLCLGCLVDLFLCFIYIQPAIILIF